LPLARKLLPYSHRAARNAANFQSILPIWATRSRDEHDSIHGEEPGLGCAAANRGRLRPMDAGKSLPVADAGSVACSLRGGFYVSSITSAVSGLLTSPSFHGHGHRRGAHATSSSASSSSTTSSSNSIGQLPVGASTALFSGLVQSFEQAIGSQATSAVTGAGATAATQAPSAGTTSGSASTTQTAGTAATPGQGQELQAFQHSLVQALKQDGLTSNGTGNIVSSLQSLIQQLGPNGKPTAATETLTSTFQNLVNGVNGSAGVAATSPASSSSGSSNSGLQSFLNNLLQNVQASTSAGSNVNTHV
jgi:hypothetical protein